MEKKVFCSDLDNTLIYSFRHSKNAQGFCAQECCAQGPCVELYQGREISFMTERTAKLLKEAAGQMLFVPVTTRTAEQYERIELGIGPIAFALVCNGGVLLENGRENVGWYEESLRLTEESRMELYRAKELLKEDADRDFELRSIRELFLFTKSRRPLLSAERLRQALDGRLVDVLTNGVKVYVVPKALNKGAALRRLRERLQAETIVAAGDSEFDVSMIREADIGFAPKPLADGHTFGKNVRVIPESHIFSEEVLRALVRSV